MARLTTIMLRNLFKSSSISLVRNFNNLSTTPIPKNDIEADLRNLISETDKKNINTPYIQDMPEFVKEVQDDKESLLSRVFTNSNMKQVPMNQVFEFKASPVVDNKVLQDSSEVKTTVFKNGLKIVTRQGVSPNTNIGIHFNHSVRDESIVGASHLISRYALEATTNRTAYRMVRDIARHGGVFSSEITRERNSFKICGPSENANAFVELLADMLNNPVYDANYIGYQVNKTIAATPKDSESLLSDLIHTAAFGAKSLGRTLHPSADAVNSITSEKLFDARAEMLNPSLMTITASGVEHNAFLKTVDKYFGELSSAASKRVPSAYAGGIKVSSSSKGEVAAVAWKGPATSSDKYRTLQLLNNVLGNRNLGPVLYGYSDISLFGLTVCGGAKSISSASLLNDSTAILKDLKVTAEELSMAKGQLLADKSSWKCLVHIPTDYKHSSEVEKINATTSADIQSLAHELLKSTPSIAVAGENVRLDLIKPASL